MSSYPTSTGGEGRALRDSTGTVFNTRKAYTKSLCEASKHFFIATNNLCKVESLVIAGTAHLKDKLLHSSFLDPRISAVTKAETVTVAYGGTRGLRQAMEQCQELVKDDKWKKQEKHLEKLFFSMSRALPVAFGLNEVLSVHQAYAAEEIFLYEDMQVEMFVFELQEKLLSGVNELPKHLYCLVKSGEEVEEVWKEKMGKYGEFLDFYDIKEEENLVDWILNNCNGAKVRLISETSEMGSQFVNGLEGCAAIVSPDRKDVLEQFGENGSEEGDLEEFL